VGVRLAPCTPWLLRSVAGRRAVYAVAGVRFSQESPISECSSAWWSTAFGTPGPRVQITPLRPYFRRVLRKGRLSSDTNAGVCSKWIQIQRDMCSHRKMDKFMAS
jgi:hypothetical protein